MSDKKLCQGCGQELMASDLPGVQLVCPDLFTESDTFHDMIPDAPIRQLAISALIEESEEDDAKNDGI
jgi:hypothetical protein